MSNFDEDEVRYTHHEVVKINDLPNQYQPMVEDIADALNLVLEVQNCSLAGEPISLKQIDMLHVATTLLMARIGQAEYDKARRRYHERIHKGYAKWRTCQD